MVCFTLSSPKENRFCIDVKSHPNIGSKLAEVSEARDDGWSTRFAV
jgi:hypothetical protein